MNDYYVHIYRFIWILEVSIYNQQSVMSFRKNNLNILKTLYILTLVSFSIWEANLINCYSIS